MTWLAIFDVDGTLVDSQHAIAAAMAGAHQQAGIAPPAHERVIDVVGLSLPQAFRRLHPGLDDAAIDTLVAGYHEACRSAEGLAHAPLFPGVAQGLPRLAAHPDLVLGTATGKGRRGLDATLVAHDMHGLFATLQCGDDHPSKPHPAMVLAALAATGQPRSRAVMVGDTEYDMAMARTAGVMAVGVAWGYHAPARLRAAGAACVAADWGALETLLAELAT